MRQTRTGKGACVLLHRWPCCLALHHLMACCVTVLLSGMLGLLACEVCAASVWTLAPAGADPFCRNNVLDIFELRSLLEQTNGDMEDSIFVSALHSCVLAP